MGNRVSLHRYRVTLLASLVIGLLSLWPMLLTPLGRAYVNFCARYLTDVPFSHHYPPLLVAFVGLVSVPLAVLLVVASLRQVAGQRHLSAALAARVCDPRGDAQRIVACLGAEKQVVFTSDAAVYAFCSGLVRPRVYLSRGLLNLLTDDEVEAVIRHELHHVARRDPLRFFVSQLARRLAVFFPALTSLDDRVRINAELAADRAALHGGSVEALASALIKVVRAAPVVEHRAILAAFSPTDARVAALLGQPVRIPLDRRDVVVSLGFALNLLVVLFWLAMHALPLPPECTSCPPF